MQSSKNIRVILASEHPHVQRFLKEMVEKEEGAVVVGHADNAGKALAMARNLRPDITIIDSYLPHSVGRDNMPLSRIGGLDAAQTISGEIPNTRVVLLPNLNDEGFIRQGLNPDNIAFFSRKTKGSGTMLTLQDLYYENAAPSPIIFANLELEQRNALKEMVSNISDKAVVFGGLGILVGVSLILTMILAQAGIILAFAMATTMVLGLLGKIIVASWPGLFSRRKRQRKEFRL